MLRVAAMVLALALSPAGGHRQATDDNICAAPQLKAATIQNTVTVEALHRDLTHVAVKTVVTVPSSWPLAGSLRANPYSGDFMEAASCFLPNYTSDYRDHDPAVSEANGTVTLVDDVAMDQDAFDWREADGTHLGFWTVAPTGESLRLAFDRLFNGGPVLANPATWTLSIDTGGLPVRKTNPRPTTDDGHGHLTWTGLSSADASQVEAALRWPSVAAVRGALGHWPQRVFPELCWTLSWLVLFVTPLLLARRIRRLRAGDPALSEPLRLLTLACRFGLAATLLIVLDHVARADFMRGIENAIAFAVYPPMAGETPALTISDMLVKGEWDLLIILCCWMYRAAWRRRTPRRRLPSLTVAAIGIAVVGWPAVWSVYAPLQSYYFTETYDLDVGWRSLGILAVAAIPAVIVLFFAYAATIGLMTTALPRRWYPGRNERRFRIRVLAAAWFAALVTVALAVLFSRSTWQHFSVLGNDNGIRQTNWVVGSVWWMSTGFFGELPVLLAFPAAAGVLAVLRVFQDGSHGVFFRGGGGAVEIPALAFVFGAWAVGTAGPYATLQLPIAFTVAYLLVRKGVLSRRLEALDSVVETTGTAIGKRGYLLGYQSELLAAGARIDQLTRELGQLDREPPAFVADAATRRAEIVAELDALATSWSRYEPPAIGSVRAEPAVAPSRYPAWWPKSSRWPWQRGAAGSEPEPEPVPVVVASIRTPTPIDPAQTALALGPGRTWWDNGVQAVRVAAIPAAVATGYYLYRGWRTPGYYWPMGYPYGVIDTLAGTTDLAVAWLALAFVLGCLYPYLLGRTGPQKGAVLGLVAAVGEFADACAAYIFGGTPNSKAPLDAIIDVAFGAVVGLLLDGRTLRYHHRELSRMVAIYRLASVRVAASWGLTIVLALVGVWQQAHVSDQISQQQGKIVTEIVKDARSQIGH